MARTKSAPKRYASGKSKTTTLVSKRKMRVPRSINNSTSEHLYVRTTQPFNISWNPSVGFNNGVVAGDNLGFIFSLNGVYYYIGSSFNVLAAPLPSVAEFVALYELYRIEKIEMHVMYNHLAPADGSQVFSAGAYLNQATGSPQCYTGIDYQVNGTLTDATGILQLDTAKLVQLGTSQEGPSGHVRTLYPKLIGACYNAPSGTVLPMDLGSKQWVQTGSTLAEYSGIRIGANLIGGASNVNVGAVSFYFKYWIRCKNTK